MRLIGAITIGQSPRADLMPEIESWLGAGVRIVESGALDPFSKAEVDAIFRATEGHVLVTRLRDGSEVKLHDTFVVPRLQECVRHIEDQVELILLLCTGTLPRLDSRKLILYLEQLLFSTVQSLGVQRIGVLTPGPEQIGDQHERWSKIVSHVVVEAASPYGAVEQIDNAALNLNRHDIDLIVLDCIGYSQAMKSRVRARVDRPVLLARSVVARLASELIS